MDSFKGFGAASWQSAPTSPFRVSGFATNILHEGVGLLSQQPCSRFGVWQVRQITPSFGVLGFANNITFWGRGFMDLGSATNFSF